MKAAHWAIITCVALCSAAIVVFAFSPYFYITQVNITGNASVSTEEIRERLNIAQGTNILTFRRGVARQRIMQNLFIDDVTIVRTLPNRLDIEVSERRLAAYVEHAAGGFLYLDDVGRVLEVREYMTEPLPILEGLNFVRFQLGEVLDTHDVTAFNIVVHYAQLLVQYDLISQVTRMNVSDPANIRIIINNRIEFNVGGIAGADEKIRTMADVLYRMPNVEYARGFMDLSVLRERYIFEILR